VAPKKKHSLLPVLTVLFLVSYGLMTMLIVEQGSTIDSQRALIRELFRDSTELTAVKIKAQREHAQASAQNPSSQCPSAQVPTKQAPSSQSGAQAQNQIAPQGSRVPAPSKPASDLSDTRRALVKI
jgi:hypothetical protein